jgi:hypothetical protein
VTPDLILTSGDDLIYEKHIYGIRRPKMADTIGDYTIKALYSAKQKDSDKEVNSVDIRHLMSGKKVNMKPRRAAGINEIESMATAVQRRMNAMDFSGPRMVNGWDACGNCDYKLLCFDGEGIMQRYNLPLSGRLSLVDDLINEMSQQLSGYTEEQKEIGSDFARVFLPLITQNPGMTKEQIDRLITGI